MKHSLKYVTSVLLLTSIVSCDFVRMDYIPTSEQITASHSAFLVMPNSITGHYANMDVDSRVFTYTSQTTDADTFWQSIEEASSADGWNCIIEKVNQRYYERIIPKTGQQAFHSAEQVRVHYDPIDNIAVVAWVQGDSFDPVDHFDTIGEASFANRTVWPRFESLAEKAEP